MLQATSTSNNCTARMEFVNEMHWFRCCNFVRRAAVPYVLSGRLESFLSEGGEQNSVGTKLRKEVTTFNFLPMD